MLREGSVWGHMESMRSSVRTGCHACLLTHGNGQFSRGLDSVCACVCVCVPCSPALGGGWGRGFIVSGGASDPVQVGLKSASVFMDRSLCLCVSVSSSVKWEYKQSFPVRLLCGWQAILLTSINRYSHSRLRNSHWKGTHTKFSSYIIFAFSLCFETLQTSKSARIGCWAPMSLPSSTWSLLPHPRNNSPPSCDSKAIPTPYHPMQQYFNLSISLKDGGLFIQCKAISLPLKINNNSFQYHQMSSWESHFQLSFWLKWYLHTGNVTLCNAEYICLTNACSVVAPHIQDTGPSPHPPNSPELPFVGNSSQPAPSPWQSLIWLLFLWFYLFQIAL